MGAADAWPFWVGGMAIGAMVVLLAWVAGKGFGVSTSFGSVCSLVSGLTFFRKKPYNEGWRLWFLVGLPLGGFLSVWLAGDPQPQLRMGMFEQMFGESWAAKAVVLVLGGFLVGYGSRWAGG